MQELLKPIKKDDPLIASHKLSAQDYKIILEVLGREPNLIELGIFSAMWSEHCSYKSSKKYLKDFPTTADWVVVGPGENAGAIKIDKNLAAIFKVESHNHPSFIEPKAGAATGVGGIIRDIFTMGARPVASLNSIRFGRVQDSGSIGKKHKYLLKGVVEGIGGYGNCMGVPMIGGEMSFEECYNGNILVNAFCLGIAKIDEIFYAKAQGVGNLVIYVGSKTGRDGLGGAVMSSDSFSKDDTSLRPTVQIGDPFAEKMLLEACMELFKSGTIIGIQDMGAAGLTSSSFEMARKSGSGMKMYLNLVPMRESAMNPYEFMLSESQERMLICAKKGYEQKVIDIFKKWEVDVAVIGEVTDSGAMELYWEDVKCAEIPIDRMLDSTPIVDRPVSAREIDNTKVSDLKTSNKLEQIYKMMLSSIEISDKKWVYSQYDAMVQTNTILQGGECDGSVIRLKDSKKALAMDIHSSIRYCYLNPRMGAKISVANAGRKCVTRGAMPLAISDCLNFGSPSNPQVMWEFKEVCEGIKEACSALKTPVVSGNVSLHNQSDGLDIYPTPSIVSVGIIDGVENFIDSKLKKNGNEVYLIGDFRPNFAGSLAQKIFEGKIYGAIPHIDLFKERVLWELTLEQISCKNIISAKDVGEGGVAIALTQMALLGQKGVVVDKEFAQDIGLHLFAQSTSSILVEVVPDNVDKLKLATQEKNLVCIKVATIRGEDIEIDSMKITLQEARELYFNSFAKFIT